ncbi:hypothetical protein D9M71_478000 [compost metagenome]
MFGKVQCGALEPLGAGHLRAFEQHGVGLLVEANVEEVDNGLPEVGALLDGPLVQGRVVVNLEVIPLIDEAPEGLHAGFANAFDVGLPEDVGHGLPLLMSLDPFAGKPAPTGDHISMWERACSR